MTARLCVAFAVAVLVSAASAFEHDLLLTPPESRSELIRVLAREGRGEEAEVLAAAWAGDAPGFVRAAGRELSRKWDRRLASRLARELERIGRTEESAEVRRQLSLRGASAARPKLSVYVPDLSGRRPIVFLHGYGGDASTWSDFVSSFRKVGYGGDDLLVFQYYDSDDNSAGLARDLTTLGGDVDEDIEAIAERVASRIRVWLRRRAGITDGDASMDATLPAPDFVCHSMGGLVFRCLYAKHPELVHRCADLGTPHFGQNLSGSFLGEQTVQMKYGSPFLWKLAAQWFFLGKACKDMIFIAGVASETDFDYWDGLVHPCSATLLTRADGDEYARRVFAVYRIHSTAMAILHDGKRALAETKGSTDDVVFRLVRGYFTDTDGFENGGAPDFWSVLRSECGNDERATEARDELFGQGGIFVQVVDARTNSASAVQQPLTYSSSSRVVDYLSGSDAKLTPDSKGCRYWEHGDDGEGCHSGLTMIFGKIPVGDYDMSVLAPANVTPWKFPFSRKVTVSGGGIDVLRVRPVEGSPLTRFALTDDRGEKFNVTVPNDWFAANGLVPSAEALSACVEAGSLTGTNGYPAAVSQWLGLDPNAADSTLAFSAVSVADGQAALRLRAGAAELTSASASAESSRATYAAGVVIQTRASMTNSWTDLSPVQIDDGPWWRMGAAQSNAFFRAVIRPR